MTQILQIEKTTQSSLLDALRSIIKEEISTAQNQKRLAYSKKEFAQTIGKSESFVDQERRAGRLEWKRNGGTVSIPASELEKYI